MAGRNSTHHHLSQLRLVFQIMGVGCRGLQLRAALFSSQGKLSRIGLWHNEARRPSFITLFLYLDVMN